MQDWTLGAVLLVLAGCDRVPAQLRPAVRRHREQLQRFAERVAATQCPNPHLAAGWGAASPATGTELATDPDVLQVVVNCNYPGAAAYGFPRLYLDREAGRGGWDTRRSWVTLSAQPRERLVFPSEQANDAEAADLEVQRPTPAGGVVSVVVALRAR